MVSSEFLVDILIPTYRRPVALVATLTSLLAQSYQPFRLLVSDQTEGQTSFSRPEAGAIFNILYSHGNSIALYRHLPRRGMAEQRQFLLDQSRAPYVLFLDDDLILEPFVLEMMLEVIQSEGCGFVGCATIGLSYLNDIRPDEQAIELWDGKVRPEVVRPDLPGWQRYRLHNAANVWHVQRKLGASHRDPLKYRVAWIGGCVLYDAEKLRSVGGFSFWKDLPEIHAGEDVLAELRVMELYGGCGILPSGVYHQELSTTLPDREIDAPKYLPISLVR